MEGRNKAKGERNENWLVCSHPGSPRWSSFGNVRSAENPQSRREDLEQIQNEFYSPLTATAPFASSHLSSLPLGELKRLGLSVTVPGPANIPDPAKNPRFGIHRFIILAWSVERTQSILGLRLPGVHASVCTNTRKVQLLTGIKKCSFSPIPFV